MTDKDKIKEEIERLRQNNLNSSDSEFFAGKNRAYNELLNFIDSLPEEHNEDLEEAAYNYCEKVNHRQTNIITDSFKAGAEWQEKKMLGIAETFYEQGKYEQEQKDLEDSLKSDMTMPNKFYEKGKADVMKEMKDALQTEYEKGRFDTREEIMKDAVEAEVMYPASSSTLQIRYKLPKNTKLKYGDKVKIIIVKEE